MARRSDVRRSCRAAVTVLTGAAPPPPSVPNARASRDGTRAETATRVPTGQGGGRLVGAMKTLTGTAVLPLADSPLGRTIATTATDIWNDSCAVDELEYAISYGAVGATANPTIVADVWKADPARWRDRVRALAAERADATEIDLAWAIVEEMSLAGARAARAGVRGVRRASGSPVDADRPDAVPLARPDARPGRALRTARAEHHRQVPGDRGRRARSWRRRRTAA